MALLDLGIVAGAAQRSLEMFTSVAGTWLPFALIFLATWTTGEILWMLPSDEQRREHERRAGRDQTPPSAR